MKISRLKQGDVNVCFLEGKLDFSQSFVLEKEMNALISEGVDKIIFDLGKLDYLSSSGIRVFISLIRHVKSRDGRIVFCNLTDPVSNLIEMVSLQDDLEIFPTLYDALLSFEPGKGS